MRNGGSPRVAMEICDSAPVGGTRGQCRPQYGTSADTGGEDCGSRAEKQVVSRTGECAKRSGGLCRCTVGQGANHVSEGCYGRYEARRVKGVWLSL